MFWKETESADREKRKSNFHSFFFYYFFHSLIQFNSECLFWTRNYYWDWKQNDNYHLDPSLQMLFTSIQQDPLKATRWNVVSSCCLIVRSTVLWEHRSGWLVICPRQKGIRNFFYIVLWDIISFVRVFNAKNNKSSFYV